MLPWTRAQDSSPAQLSVLYVANPPFWIERVMSQIRPSPKDPKDGQPEVKLVLLKSKAEFDIYFTREALPPAYGGTLQHDWAGQVERWGYDEKRKDAGFDVSELVG